MTLFLQQVVDGISSGAIYASLALALVLIFRSTHIVNFAQGEMAMFATYVAWQLTEWNVPIVPAILITLVLAFAGGMLVERLVIRHFEKASVLTVVIVTLGLFLVFNSFAPFIWGYTNKAVPSSFGSHVYSAGKVRISTESLGIVVVLLVTTGLLFALFQYTKVGLAMRAAAANPESSSLVGIKVTQMLLLGWGLAAALGALSGTMVAPRLILDPNLMGSVQIYAFAAATLGGFDSPLGAVVGGLIVGVAENLAGTYIGFIGNDLKLLVALMIIFAVLIVKPSGLFGKAQVARV